MLYRLLPLPLLVQAVALVFAVYLAESEAQGYKCHQFVALLLLT